MKTDQAKEMYQKFLLKLGQAYDPSKIKGKNKKIMCQRLGKNVSTKFTGTWEKGLVYGVQLISYYILHIIYIYIYIYILDGVFGAMMTVDIANDGK